MIKLYLCGLIQMLLATFNVGVIAKKRVFISILSSFALALTWGIVIHEFINSMDGYGAVTSYAFGASMGTGIGVYLTKKMF